MTFTEIASLDTSPTDDAAITEELVARARAIAPTLVELQDATERRTFYSPEVHELFRDAGFYKILVPKMFGGLGLGIDAFLRVSMEISRGCSSTGWMLTLGTSHALTVGSIFGEEAQRELFGDGDFICPTTVRPQGTTVRAAGDDGWIINGDFNFCSGAPYATHFMSHTIPEGAGAPMVFIATSDQFTRLDDWGTQIGLKGSGSHSLRFENAFVPDLFTLPATNIMTLDLTAGTPGERLHGSGLYAGSSYSFFMLEAAAVSVGTAKNALDAYGELMETKQSPLPPFAPRKEDVDYQRYYGTAAGKIAAAEAAVLSCTEQWLAAAEGRAFTPETDMRLVSISTEVIELAWQAIADSLIRTAGSTAVRTGERIERVYRDMSTIHTHNALVAFAELATRGIAKAHFGVA